MADAKPRVILETTKGSITLELDSEAAPKTVENFLSYVDDGFYDGTIFHRVIANFMIQGGGMLPDLSSKPDSKAPIENEAKTGLSNKRGAIAMARTADPHSATSQFFINVVDNDFLNHPGQDGWGYCAFGEVVDGMDVVDAIRNVKTTSKPPYDDVPVEDVVITSAKRAE